MRLGAIWACTTALTLVACIDERPLECQDASAPDGVLLTFPDENDDMVPFRNGGAVRIDVRATRCGFVGNADGAEVFLVTDCAGNTEATRTTTVSLVRDVDGAGALADTWVGEVSLTCPVGGAITVGARALGDMGTHDGTIVLPSITPATPTSRRDVSRVLSTLCVDTSADEGKVEFELFGATVGSGTTMEATIDIRPGSCADRTDASARHAPLAVASLGSAFQYLATLQGTEVTTFENVSTADVVNIPTVTLSFPAGSAVVGTELPAVGDVVRFEALVEVNGTPTANQLVTVTGLPSGLTIAPPTLTTRTNGIVTGFFEAPSGAHLLLHAASGSGVASVLLTRPADAQLVLGLEFPDGSAAADGEIDLEGSLVEFAVTASRGGAPAVGEAVTLVTLPADVESDVLGVTDSAGRVSAILLAPAADRLVLSAEVGSVTTSTILERPAPVDPLPVTVAISFPSGSPAASGDLALEGEVVEIVARVLRGSAPASGEPVSFVVAPSLPVVAAGGTSDALGMLSGFFVAPAATELIVQANSGDAADTAILIRP